MEILRQETYSQIRPHIWKKSELSRLRFVSFARVRKNSRPLPVGCTSTRPDWCYRRCHVDGMSCKNWSSKASGSFVFSKTTMVNHHPSLNLPTFKPNKIQATRNKFTTTTNNNMMIMSHQGSPPFPEVEPTRSSVQGAGPAQGQWCQAQRPEHQGTVQTMPCKSWKIETFDFEGRFFPVLSEIETLH